MSAEIMTIMAMASVEATAVIKRRGIKTGGCREIDSPLNVVILTGIIAYFKSSCMESAMEVSIR